MIYLASPYSHPEADVREARYIAACQAAAELMRAGHVVYSPIAHSHPIATHLPEALLLDHEFWMEQCLPMIELSSAVYVLVGCAGWELSRGVSREIAHAMERGIPVLHFRNWQG
jgi:hypothetical protein